MSNGHMASHTQSNAAAAAGAVPVHADDIARRSYEQQFLIEDKVIASLVEIINQGIRDQVSHGMLEYEFHVPSFIYGFPRFGVEYVALRLREMYAARGFHVTGEGSRGVVAWTQQRPAKNAPATSRAPGARRKPLALPPAS